MSEKDENVTKKEENKDSTAVNIGHAIFAGLDNMRGSLNSMGYNLSNIDRCVDASIGEMRQFNRNFKEVGQTLELILVELHAANLLKIAELDNQKIRDSGYMDSADKTMELSEDFLDKKQAEMAKRKERKAAQESK